MTQGGTAATLRIATWNILHGMDLRRAHAGAATPPVDVGAVTEGLRGLDADVIALQEVDRDLARSGRVDQTSEIANRLGLHAVFAPSLIGNPDDQWRAVRDHADPGGEAYGVALLSRSPLSAVQRVDLPGGGDGRRRSAAHPNPGWDREPRVALSARLTVGDRPVSVTVAHLSYLPWRGLRQLRHLTGVLGTRAPAVLLGDFNLPPWAVAAAARGWGGAGGAPTYPAAAPRVQIDQVLVRGLTVGGISVAEPSTSDHRAVVADLLVA